MVNRESVNSSLFFDEEDYNQIVKSYDDNVTTTTGQKVNYENSSNIE